MKIKLMPKLKRWYKNAMVRNKKKKLIHVLIFMAVLASCFSFIYHTNQKVQAATQGNGVSIKITLYSNPQQTINQNTTVTAIVKFPEPNSTGFPKSYNLSYIGNNTFSGGIFYDSTCAKITCSYNTYEISAKGAFTGNSTYNLNAYPKTLQSTVFNNLSPLLVQSSAQSASEGTLNGTLKYGNKTTAGINANLFKNQQAFDDYCGNFRNLGGNLLYSDQTDSSGKFSITNIAPGTYFFFSDYIDIVGGNAYGVGGNITIAAGSQNLPSNLSNMTTAQLKKIFNSNGSNVKISKCTYPSISGVSPNSGPTAGGTSVVISGSGFTGTSGSGGVTFGGVPAESYIVNSGSKITAVTPANKTPGPVTVVVTSNGVSTYNPETAIDSSQQFTYVAPGTAEVEPASCESTGGAMAYITCGIINAITGAEASLENIIISLLKTPSLSLSDGSKYCSNNSGGTSQQKANSCIFQVWSNFRIYGDIFLVIALLVAVIVEAMGGGLISNYTIKKMLPRIIVAVILINLSIYIVAILEDIFNVLGAGIYDLISAPFSASNDWNFKLNSSGSGDFLGLFLGGLFAGGLALLFASFSAGKAATHATAALIGDAIGFILLFVVIPILILIIGVLSIVIFRQAILILLLMSSPVAFALYCLPNTEQYFKKWWDLLIKTLAVYPIVVTIFCMTQVMAIIFSGNTVGDPFLSKIMTIIAVVAPLALVPFAFKISGGVVGGFSKAAIAMGSRINSMTKGNPLDPNSSGNKSKAKFKNAREQVGLTRGAAFAFGRGMVRGRGGLSNRAQSGAIAVGSRQAAVTQQYGESILEKNPTYIKYKENSDFLEALINKKGLEQNIKDDEAIVNNPTSTPAEKAAAQSRIANNRAALSAASSIHINQGVKAVATLQAVKNIYGIKAGQAGHNQIMEYAAIAAGATLVKDSAGNAIGFEGPNAGVAKQILTSYKVSLKGQRDDLADLGSTSYNPVAAYKKLDWEKINHQRTETLVGLEEPMLKSANAKLSTSASPSERQAVETSYQDLVRHLEELRFMAERGYTNPVLADAARKQYIALKAEVDKNPGSEFSAWAKARDPITGRTNYKTFAAQARRPEMPGHK